MKKYPIVMTARENNVMGWQLSSRLVVREGLPEEVAFHWDLSKGINKCKAVKEHERQKEPLMQWSSVEHKESRMRYGQKSGRSGQWDLATLGKESGFFFKEKEVTRGFKQGSDTKW